MGQGDLQTCEWEEEVYLTAAMSSDIDHDPLFFKHIWCVSIPTNNSLSDSTNLYVYGHRDYLGLTIDYLR